MTSGVGTHCDGGSFRTPSEASYFQVAQISPVPHGFGPMMPLQVFSAMQVGPPTSTAQTSPVWQALSLWELVNSRMGPPWGRATAVAARARIVAMKCILAGVVFVAKKSECGWRDLLVI